MSKGGKRGLGITVLPSFISTLTTGLISLILRKIRKIYLPQPPFHKCMSSVSEHTQLNFPEGLITGRVQQLLIISLFWKHHLFGRGAVPSRANACPCTLSRVNDSLCPCVTALARSEPLSSVWGPRWGGSSWKQPGQLTKTHTNLSGCPQRGHPGYGGTWALVLPQGAWEKLGALLLGKSVCGFTRLPVLNGRLVWKMWVQRCFLIQHKEKRADIHNCLPEKKLRKKKGHIDAPKTCTILHQLAKRKYKCDHPSSATLSNEERASDHTYHTSQTLVKKLGKKKSDTESLED